MTIPGRLEDVVVRNTSFTKMTKITERLRFQFRAEAFNVFNHNYFGRDNPDTGTGSATFGVIRPSTVSTQNILPRQIQLGFKVFW
jgi:hypothetical protein